MKRRKRIVKGAALGAALTGITLGFGGCASMQPQDVYGPPPDVQTDAEEPYVFSPEEVTVETVYGPPSVAENETGFDEAANGGADASVPAGGSSAAE